MRFLLFSVVLVFLAASFYGQKKRSHSGFASQPKVGALPQAPIAKERRAPPRHEKKPPFSKPRPEAEDAATAMVFDALEFMEATQARPSKVQQRQEKLKELADNPQARQFLASLLMTPAKTQETFGLRQAQARVLALDVLEVAAEQGLSTEIEEALDQLFSEGAEELQNKGRHHDLADLLAAWVKAADSEQVFLQPKILFNRFPYRKEFQLEFARAFFYVYGTQINNPDFVERFQHAMKRSEI